VTLSFSLINLLPISLALVSSMLVGSTVGWFYSRYDKVDWDLFGRRPFSHQLYIATIISHTLHKAMTLLLI
jgi:hypothetical protein